MEINIVVLLINMYIYLIINNIYLYIFIYMIVLIVCEAVLGLSLLVLMIRSEGNDYLKLMNLN